MKLFVRLPIIIAILMLPTGIANAQMNFLKRGKDLLRSSRVDKAPSSLVTQTSVWVSVKSPQNRCREGRRQS